MIFPDEDNWFVTIEDIATVCACDPLTAYKALIASGKRTLPDAGLCRMAQTGKPHEPNFANFFKDQLWKWPRLGELKQIIDEYIRMHPSS